MPPAPPLRPGPRLVPAATLAAVAAGGAAGTLARWGVAEVVPVGSSGFPWATLVANAAGALLLGAVVTLLVGAPGAPGWIRPLVATGFCGSFTTVSSFVVETDLLARDGEPVVAAVYTVVTIAAGLLAVRAGRAMTIGRVPALGGER